MDRRELLVHVGAYYGDEPEYLWEDTPDCFILRHRENRKWYAVVMSVPGRKLGLDGDGPVDVLNVKCDPRLSGAYLCERGILPAWHMNKLHWLSVLLDGSAADETVEELLAISYGLTGKKPGKRREA